MLGQFFWTLRKLKSKNKQGILHVLVWLKVIIIKTIKHQNNPYSVIPTHDHQTLNVSSNLTRLHRHKNLGNLFAVLLQVACRNLFPLNAQIGHIFLGSNVRLNYILKILKMSFLTKKIPIDWLNGKFNNFPWVIVTLVS